MTKIDFEPQSPLIIFHCKIEHTRTAVVKLALDTGATMTIVSHKVLEKIGADLANAESTTFGNATGAHSATYTIVKSVGIQDAIVNNLEVVAYTLPEDYGIDGVIGLNFLRHFRIVLDFEKGILTLESI